MGNTKLKNLWQDIVESVRGTERAVWVIGFANMVFLGIIAVILFRRGKWKKRKV